MLHPSYSDLMQVVNSEVEQGEHPVVQSRYSIVLATAKRARQIVAGDQPLINEKGKKPLSMAVEELYKGKIKILTEEEAAALNAGTPENSVGGETSAKNKTEAVSGESETGDISGKNDMGEEGKADE